MTVSSLHNEAMDTAEKAFSEKRANSGKAADLFAQACKLEKQAALLAKEQKASEKTVAILLRSAASLAFNAGNYTEVKSLVELALNGDPSADIKGELDVLFESIKTNPTNIQGYYNKVDDTYENIVNEEEVKYQSASKEQPSLVKAGDEELIDEFRRGNPQALKELFNRYNDPLIYFVNRIINNKEVTLDIVSDAFVKLLIRKEDFHSITQVKAFLYVSARNASLNNLQTHKHIVKTSFQYLQLLEKEDDNEVQNSILETELLTSIYEAMDKLPPRARSIFNLRYIEGLTTKEIAKQLNVSNHTIANEIFRARTLLKKYLKS